jgi:F420-dependent oxidoreductase-like protein
VLIGVCLDPSRPWSEVHALAQLADNAGFATVYAPDHFMSYARAGTPSSPDPVLEGWTLLTALAARTRRIRLATLVLGATYRHPAVVANMAATLDHVAGGRLTLGLGAGWQQNEHTAYGIELPPVRERLDRFEESTRIIRALLGGGSVDFDGSYFQLADARCDPAPVQQPLPLLVAGAGERRTIPIAARHGDAWHAWADPSEFRRKSDVLDEACTDAGRDPACVRRLTGQVLLVTTDDTIGSADDDDDDEDIVGSVSWVGDRLAAYRDAGVDEFIIRDHRATPLGDVARSLEAVAADLAPHLQ